MAAWEGLNPPYRTVVADPPWRYTNPTSNHKANAEAQYSVMKASDIALMNVRDLADDDAHLWLWTTNAMMEDAHKIARAWGFSVLTIVTWCKPGPGLGAYVRNNTEHVLLASRGRPSVPDEKPLSSWYQWPRGSHSTKPDQFFDLVDRVSPSPRVELFARQQRLGYDSWGRGYEVAEPTLNDACRCGHTFGHHCTPEFPNGGYCAVSDTASPGYGCACIGFVAGAGEA